MKIYSFKTKNFHLVVETSRDILDTSYMEKDLAEECKTKVKSGEWKCFETSAILYFHNEEVGADYLSNSIYATPHEFRDNVGLNIKSREDGCHYGSYFHDMIKTCIEGARNTMKKKKEQAEKLLSTFPKLREVNGK